MQTEPVEARPVRCFSEHSGNMGAVCPPSTVSGNYRIRSVFLAAPEFLDHPIGNGHPSRLARLRIVDHDSGRVPIHVAPVQGDNLTPSASRRDGYRYKPVKPGGTLAEQFRFVFVREYGHALGRFFQVAEGSNRRAPEAPAFTRYRQHPEKDRRFLPLPTKRQRE